MKALKLFCVVLCYSVSTACANLPFLELGATPGLCPILLPANDDGISEAVSPPQGFPIWGVSYSDFFIMANGVIYIGNSFGECCPLKFTDLPPGTTPFIAPYWIDSDPSVRGNVSYEVHIGNSSPLQQVSDYISSNQSVEFSGTWMMVAYWWDVPELFLDNTQNTYQGVLITDGLSSFAVFIYRCELLESESIGGIGFYINSMTFMEHALSNTRNSSAVACQNPQSEWSALVYQLNAPLEAPTSLEVGDKNSTSVSITWKAVSCEYCYEGISGYSVQHWDEAEDAVVTVSRIHTVNQHTLHGLTPSTKYRIKVAAVSNEVIGAYSSPVPAETTITPETTDIDHDEEVNVNECVCTNDGVSDVTSIQPGVASGGVQREEFDGACIGGMVGAFLGGVLASAVLGVVFLIILMSRKSRKSISSQSPDHEVTTNPNQAYGTVTSERYSGGVLATKPNMAYGSFKKVGSNTNDKRGGSEPAYETIVI